MQRHLDPLGADVVHVLNFLAEKAQEGMAYRSISTLRSAISVGYLPKDDHPVGEHPLVRQLLRGIRFSVPPESWYFSLWDLNVVLRMFKIW